MLSPGTVVDGKFEIVELLGEGGMGTVYAARHTNMDRTIALKLLKASLVSDEDKVARFRNEARVLSSLQHRNIISIHAIGIADTGQPYMAMDIVSGESISDAIERRGPFTQQEALQICVEICAGLHYAHANQIIHRDIKPSNIILSTADGGKPVPKLVDFGIAKMLNPELQQNLTQTGVAVGSVFYLSPGQFEGRAADPASDVYALGCTLYEMLTGVPPYESDNLFQTALSHKHDALVPINQRNPNAKVDPSVEQIVACMLAKEHHLRYQSAEAVQQDLTAALQGKPVDIAGKLAKATSAKAPRSARGPVKRTLAFTVITLTACAIMSATLVMFATKSNDSNLRSDVKTLLAKAQAHVDVDPERIAKAHEVYENTFVLATQKADETHDPLLMAQAWRLRAEIYVRILGVENKPPAMYEDCLGWELKAYNIADSALEAGKLRPDEIRQLRRERFLAIAYYLNTFLNEAGSPTPSTYKKFIVALQATDHNLDKDYKELCGDVLAGVARKAIGEHDGPACIHALTTRRLLLDATDVPAETRADELQELLPSIRENLGPNYVIMTKSIYKD